MLYFVFVFFKQPRGCDKSTVLLFYLDVHAAPLFNCDGLVMLPWAHTVALFAFLCPPPATEGLSNKTVNFLQ